MSPAIPRSSQEPLQLCYLRLDSIKKNILCHVPWEANEDISLVKYGHQPKELEVLGMLWGREAWIDQVPDVSRLVDVYVLIYEVKDWLQMYRPIYRPGLNP